MPPTPGYGETPLPEDELIALLPHVVEVLDKPISRADVYDLEQAVQEQVSEELLTAAFEGSLLLDDLLSDHFLRDLHARLYGDIWTWAGRWRQHEVNIGVAPEQISVELRNAFDNIQYRWNHTDDWSPRELGIVAHAETVRVHPFTDGMGEARGFWVIWCSSPPRTLLSCSTTGISTSRGTSGCSAASTRTETCVSSRPSSVSDQSTFDPGCYLNMAWSAIGQMRARTSVINLTVPGHRDAARD